MKENNQGRYPGNQLNRYAQLELMQWINPKAKRILDLGCGDGTTTVMMGEICPDAKLYGITYNQEEANESKAEVEVIYGDAHDLPWESGFFDVVFARHVLEHCVAPSLVIQEINRVLEMNGEAIICVPGIEKDWLVTMSDHYSVFPKALWEKLFIEYGFEIVKKEDGVWTAYYSMCDEIEYRYSLKKVRNVGEKSTVKNIYQPEKHFFTKPMIPMSISPIAIAVHNFVVFETLLPLLQRFERAGIGFDILIPDVDYDTNAQRMFNETADAITQNYKYNVLRVSETLQKKYKVALYSFVPFYFSINAMYTVRYQYGIGKPTYNFDLWSLNFDYIMCMGTYDEKYLSAYTQTILAGPLKFIDYDFSIKRKSDKYRVLYLPTYGDLCEMEEVLPQLNKLRDKYEVSIKLHHMTSYFEQERVELAKKYIDEKNIYDQTTPLLKLFGESDIVISDGSGAFFDAIIACKPVILIKPNDIPQFEHIESIENNLVKSKDVYSVSNIDAIGDVIEEIFSNLHKVIRRMSEIRAELFPICGEQTADIAMEFIDSLLTDNVNYEYLAVHRKVVSKFYEYEQMIKSKEIINEQLKNAHESQRKRLLEIIAEHKSRIQELSITLNDYIGYDAQKVGTINNLTRECSKLNEELSNNKDKIEKISQEMADYIDLDNRKNNEIESLKEQIDYFKCQLESYKQKTEELIQEKNTYVEHYEDLINKLKVELDNSNFYRRIKKLFKK